MRSATISIVTLFLCLILLFSACYEQQKGFYDATMQLERHQSALESCIINDFFAPPVASRNYMYPNLAMQYYLHSKNPNSVSPAEILKMGVPDSVSLDKKIVSLYVYAGVAEKLVFDPTALIESDSIMRAQLVICGYSPAEVDRLNAQADTFTIEFMKWCAGDNYKETRTAMKYVLSHSDSGWQPTPPNYFDALEPHWGEIRPSVFERDSSDLKIQFNRYSADTNSAFWHDLMEVYAVSKSRSKADSMTCRYWDCNPLVVSLNGHVTSSVKQLTPGGHWIRIARQISRQEQLSFEQRVYVNAAITSAIFDAFICCWDIKYSTNLVRPVSVIRREIDPTWEPLLQTPNFPEFPSGHSVVSSCAAQILEKMFGAQRTFVDSSEIDFGFAPRKFKSFDEAATQAGFSRFYGGIHYRNGVEEGLYIGQIIANSYSSKINIHAFFQK